MAILITLVAGIFFLVGAVLALLGKDKKHLSEFSIGMALSVMIMLLAFDIVPEVAEALEENYIWMFIFIVVGITILKLLDMLVPHHNHKEELDHHERHMHHIGLISSLTLIIHNVIEGIGIYNIANMDIKAGILMAIGVGLHNIPFGMEITASLNETKKNKKEIWMNIIVLTLSTVLGALIMLTIGNISEMVLGCLLSTTIGMILYLVLFELLPEIKETENKKYAIIGVIVGLLLSVCNIIIGG